MRRQDDHREQFYVGYQKKMPPELARFVSRVVGFLIAAAALLAVAVPFLHEDYALARSDFQDIRQFEGIFLARPAPHLVVVRPGETGGRAISRYVLVGRGKSGPRIDTKGLHGKHVSVTGSLIYRDSQTLIAARSAKELAAPRSGESHEPGAGEALGSFTLRGEIIDSKCYFGTMRPGNTAVHRMCAVRCIDGGVPTGHVRRS